MIDTVAPQFLSEHFTFKEAISSQKADELQIDNSHPSPEVLATAIRTAVNMEKVKVILHSVSIHVDSWIRCPELNEAVGSKPTSQHLKGEAVDFVAQGYGTPLEICRAIITNKDLIRFDQLILEHSWVHISFCAAGITPRGQVLSLINGGHYAQGLTDVTGKAYS